MQCRFYTASRKNLVNWGLLAIMFLSLPEHEPLPPGLAVAFYDKGVFTLTAPPDFKLLIIICFGTTAAGAPGPYLPRGIFIQRFPVIIGPFRTNWHFTLQSYELRVSSFK